MREYAQAFEALAEVTRLRMIRLFLDAGKELCVCELVDALEIPQYNVSRHLKVLKSAGLVGERREGRWVYYGLRNDHAAFRRLVCQAIGAIPAVTFGKDRQELQRRLKVREGGKCLKGILKARLRPVPQG